VLLLEAGSEDDAPGIRGAGNWPLNIGSDRDWAVQPQPDSHLNGRSVPLSMGKVFGVGSSFNLMIWTPGHKSDADFFASEAGDRVPFLRLHATISAPISRIRGPAAVRELGMAAGLRRRAREGIA